MIDMKLKSTDAHCSFVKGDSIDDRIISLTKGRVGVIQRNNTSFVFKKTSRPEYCNYMKAKHLLSQHNTTICICGKQYSLSLPTHIEWNNTHSTLLLDYIPGVNLEISLRDNCTYSFGAEVMKNILSFMTTIDFFWLDFAPRNIIISEQTREIFLVDFEKGFLSSYHSAYEYLALIMEEYSAFLLPVDNPYLDDLDSLFHKNKDLLRVHLLRKSKRIAALINLLGKSQIDRADTDIAIYIALIRAQIPRKKRDSIQFPIVDWEQILLDNDYEIWGRCILPQLCIECH